MRHLLSICILTLLSNCLISQDKIETRIGSEEVVGEVELSFNGSTDAIETISVLDQDGKKREFQAKDVQYVYLNDKKHFILPVLGKGNGHFLLQYLKENDSAAILIECNGDGPINGAHIFISKSFKEVIRVETVLNFNKMVKKKFSKCPKALKGAGDKKYSKKMKGLEALLEDLNEC